MRFSFLTLFLCLSLAAGAQKAAPHRAAPPQKKQAAASVMPVTTTSAKARALFQQGMTESMNFHLDRGLALWRAAVQEDRSFALAHVMIAFRTQDPAEAKSALAQANAAAPKTTPGERLFVRWITGIREGHFVSGIAAMNDLIAMYPKDKQLLSLAGNWVLQRFSYERAADLLNRALAVDPDYPPALNSAAYAYAELGDFDKAVKIMEHYAAVLPNEPNAQDSYAEILRMAGKYDAAIEHYQAALKMAPGFSIMGLADTYALKGEEERARAEYTRCNDQAEMSEDRIMCRMKSPITYVWERNFAAANQAFEAAAKWAHEHDLGLAEAQAIETMASYEQDDAQALKHLERAESVLQQNASISQSDRDEEMAHILRWRVIRSAHAGKPAVAEEALRQLRAIADRNPSENTQREYNAAQGALLMAQNKPAQAIAYLREDVKNAFSMALLVKAYEQTGDRQSAEAERSELANLHLATIDNAVVTPEFRGGKSQ